MMARLMHCGLHLLVLTKFSGGTYEQHPVEGKPARQTGSMIIYAAESADEVWEIIKSDVYAAHGVWDLDKVQVIPVCQSIPCYSFV